APHAARSRLARRVVNSPRVAADRGRGDVHDRSRPAGSDERPRDGLSAEEAPLEIDAQDVIPLALRHLEEDRTGEDAGVVDENVGRTQFFCDCRDKRLDLSGLHDIGFHDGRATAETAHVLGDGFRRRGVVQEVDADVGSILSQRYGDGPTDSLLGARDERNLARKPHAPVNPPRKCPSRPGPAWPWHPWLWLV